jgi:hypothetical protein
MPHAGWFFCTPETSFGRAVLQRLLERVTGPPAPNKSSFLDAGAFLNPLLEMLTTHQEVSLIMILH